MGDSDAVSFSSDHLIPPSSLSVPVGHTPIVVCSHRSLFVNPSCPLSSRLFLSISLLRRLSVYSLCSYLFSFVYSLCSRRPPSSLYVPVLRFPPSSLHLLHLFPSILILVADSLGGQFGLDAQGNDQHGYCGDIEFGYGDEFDEEEEDIRLLFGAITYHQVGMDSRPVMREAYNMFKDGGDPEKC
ncbi:hypothetical protein ACFE04_012302 [Oxalis oulophora]